ncbi:MAG: hypothetical protein AYK22_04535 [Thermoplasmatales archaeon SG8-52-3]|nr:MAG: hypothetical protein AYK22_04535 [Thermoplasmatales archaeon SG8-52-3]
MVKSFSLDKRTIGPWTTFERYLLKKENEHTGWLKWTSKNTFKIFKNPFSKNPLSPYTYIVPDDIIIPSEEGLIKVNIEKIVKDIKLPERSTIGYFTEQYCIVDGYEPIKHDDLPRPIITKEEFLLKLTENWKGNSILSFSKEVALNILSCPKGMYGIGGIGAQSLNPYGTKQQIYYLNATIKGLIPNDFLKINNTYLYKPIKTKTDELSANKIIMNGKTDEVSFNYLYRLSPQAKEFMMPTQVPIIIPESIYNSNKWGLDPDIFDYQMGAMLYNPIIEEENQKQLNHIVANVGNKILMKSSMQLSLEGSSLLKLAKAWGRLNLKNQIDEDDFFKMKNDVIEIYSESFDMIEDAKLWDSTYHLPLIQMPYKKNISINSNIILKSIKKQIREAGLQRISKEEIKNQIKEIKISCYEFDLALKELVDLGYLYHHKNYSEFTLADY